jgi:predicted NBD/HSP70 family sugar kinase
MATESLQTAGWIEVLPPPTGDQRSAGRPARRFRFRPTAGFVIGIDVEAVSVSAAVADLAGTVIGRDRQAAHPLLGARERLEKIRDTIAAALAAADVGSDRVLGVAVGTTGVVGPEGRIRRNSLPGWAGLHLADEIAALIDVPVSVDNHLRLSALGERWRGATQHVDDVVHLHAGQRMGLGVVVDGKPLFGFHGAAGELSRASSDAWLRAYRLLLEHPLGVKIPDLDTRLGGDKGDAGPIFDAAVSGDATARLAVEDFARSLADDMGSVIAAFDPEVVVIGGDLARAGALTIEPVQRALGASCAFPPDVMVSQLGEESIALGAIRVALDAVESRLFEAPHHLGLE